jgi:hypothetical protein
LSETLSFNDGVALRAVAADIYFRSGQSEKSYQILRALYEDRRANREQARIEFEFKVLQCLLEEKTLPAAIPQVILDSEEYRLKWGILHSLQIGEPKIAEGLWRKLRVLAPNIYGAPFDCLNPSEEKTIFFTYLSRHRLHAIKPDAIAFTPTGKLAILHQLLLDANAPLSKERLIEAIWNVPYDVSYDLRFYKLVERLKKSGPYQVLAENRAYRYSR